MKDEWRALGTGSAAVVDAQTGGIVRLTTGATTDNLYGLDWNVIRSLHVSKRVSMEMRFKVNLITYVLLSINLFFDISNRILFYANEAVGAAVNWQIRCTDGGATTAFDSGIALDTDYHIFRIECFPADEVHFYIDNVECANSPITTNIPDGAADYLQPYIYVLTNEDLAKSMDVDYVVIRQEVG